MPIINGMWVPPSQVIGEIGLEAYHQIYENKITDAKLAKKTKSASEEEFEVPTTPLDAREGFKFGCDPELFVFKDGVAVSAEGLLPGTKAYPHPVEHGAVQVDGMAAEFNIDPVTTFKDFNRNIEAVMKQLTGLLPAGYELRAIPSVVFDKDIFDAAPECAKELGCSPDYNAWAGEVNPPPKSHDNPYLRTASGHLHIGWTEGAELSDAQHIMNCRDLVKQLDWYLGGWSVKIDSDPTRRQLYGRAGACRLKDYGVEYRVLSNFWITSRDRRLAVWNRLQQAIGAMAKSYIPDKAKGGYNELLQRGINDSKLDPTLVSAYKFPLVSMTEPSPYKSVRY
jgi:hypothetical protein